MPCPNDARERCKTVTFRCTPEESEMIDRLVAMSGMTKQDYIMERLADNSISVNASVRLYKGLKDAAKSIYLELRRIHSSGDMSQESIAVMGSFVSILKDLGGYDENELSQTEAEAHSMLNMKRE